MGEEKVKDVLVENIPDWIFGLSESDLKAFVEALQQMMSWKASSDFMTETVLPF